MRVRFLPLPISLALALVAVLAAGAFASSADVALSIAVNPPEIAAGQSARVEMRLSWPGAQDAYTVESWGAPEVGGAPLTAVRDDSATTQEGGKPVFRREVSYVVHADEPGTISVAPAKVVLKAKDGASQEYRTQALGVAVRAGRVAVPLEVVAGMGIVVLLGLIAKLSRRQAPPPAPKSRTEKGRETVEGLRAVGHRDHRQFFGACVDALREGLADEAPAVLRDRDRGKIVQALREAGLAEERVVAAEALVSLCDEARFNPEPPASQERERALGLL
jgi:hypothetical protein